MKMKRVLAAVLSVLLLASLFPSAYAEEPDVQIEYFADGSYLETVITQETTGISPLATTTTKSKTSTYYSADDVALWYVRVTGTFTYNGSYASCSASSVSAQSYSSNWEIEKTGHAHYRNQASANATVNQVRENGSVVQTMYRTVTLTCSADGTFS